MKRDYYIDYLRAAATYGVVLWHSLSSVYYQFGPLKEWAFASILFGPVIRWSVAVFIMVSGALLLNRTEPAGIFYRKRLLRICIPLLVWTLLYAVAHWYHSGRGGHLFTYIIVHGLGDLLFDKLSYHFYFISIILGLYAITPFLSKMVQALSRQELGALVSIGVGVYSVRFFVPQLMVVNHFEIGSYLVYFLLGHYLYAYPPGKRLRYWIYGVGLASAITMTWLNYTVEYVGNGHQDGFYRTDGFFVYMLSIGVFTFFQGRIVKRAETVNPVTFQSEVSLRQAADESGEGGLMRRLVRRFLLFISSCSYGIYIAHPLVIAFLTYGHYKHFTFSTALSTVTMGGYQFSFIMNDTWGAIVQSLIVMTVLLLLFYGLKKAKVSRYFT